MIIKKNLMESYKYFNYIYNYHLSLNSKVSILLYHRILPSFKDNPFGTFVSLNKFEHQISYIKDKYNIISLNELFDIKKNKKIPKHHKVVLTFDDGYIDNFKYVYPILKKYSIPASFFVLTNYVNSQETTWDWNLFKIIYESNNIEKLTNIDLPPKILSKNKKELLWNLVNYFKYQNPEKRNQYINKISNKLSFDNFNYNENRSMNWDEIKEMSSNLINFGSHGLTHTSLYNQTNIFVNNELIESKKLIEKKLKQKCNSFSFPFGSRNDFSNPLIRMVLNIYDICLLNIPGSNIIKNNNLFFKRLIMHNNSNPKYLF